MRTNCSCGSSTPKGSPSSRTSTLLRSSRSVGLLCAWTLPFRFFPLEGKYHTLSLYANCAPLRSFIDSILCELAVAEIAVENLPENTGSLVPPPRPLIGSFSDLRLLGLVAQQRIEIL